MFSTPNTMEVDDPMSTRFQTLIESLMVKTTSEIVKVFTEVLLETRVEIARSWREIDELKHKLDESKEQRAEPLAKSQATCPFKQETEEVVVSDVGTEISVSDSKTIRPGDGGSKGAIQSWVAPVENTVVTQTYLEVHGPVTSQVYLPGTSLETPGTSGVKPLVNGPNQTQEPQLTQIPVKRKRGRPPKYPKVVELEKSMTGDKVVSQSTVQPDRLVDPQKPSSRTRTIILGKNRCKRAVVKRRKKIQKKATSVGISTTKHVLRDRQLLNNHRVCLCCSSDQCSLQEKKPKIKCEIIQKVYTCSRCGETFPTLANLTAHRRNTQSSDEPFKQWCYICGHRSANQCGWNLHKKIHTHFKLAENAQKDAPIPSQLHTLPKEMKAKVQVRLERISDAQLEAALFPKGSFLQSEKPSLSSVDTKQNLLSAVENPAFRVDASATSAVTFMGTQDSKGSGSQTMTMNVLNLRSESETDKNIKQIRDQMTYSVIPTASGHIQPTRNRSYSQSLTIPTVASVDCEEGSSGANDKSTVGLNSLSRKRKMSDCDHDVHNGVFPVEKILRWRNLKGRNEVRVKWMPCSLCGAKWKNTWEPAESFISYTDSRNEEPGPMNMQV